MSNTFTPPTHEAWTFAQGANLDPGERRFWSYFGGQPRGKSVVKTGGSYVLTVTPSQDVIDAADRRVDPTTGEVVPAVFLGGHEYVVSDAEAAALELAGYTVTGWTIGGYQGGYQVGY